jgi:hypothetical protein
MVWLIASVALTFAWVALADLTAGRLVSVVVYILAIPVCGGVALLRDVDRLERDKATEDAIALLARLAVLWPVNDRDAAGHGTAPVGVESIGHGRCV